MSMVYAVPVIDREGKYIGVATEGDLLWFIYDLIRNGSTDITTDMKNVFIRDIINTKRFKPVSINISDEELVISSLNDNFVPVIDDRDMFIGIVTRRSIISKMAERRKKVKELQNEALFMLCR